MFDKCKICDNIDILIKSKTKKTTKNMGVSMKTYVTEGLATEMLGLSRATLYMRRKNKKKTKLSPIVIEGRGGHKYFVYNKEVLQRLANDENGEN